MTQNTKFVLKKKTVTPYTVPRITPEGLTEKELYIRYNKLYTNVYTNKQIEVTSLYKYKAKKTKNKKYSIDFIVNK